MGVGKRQQAIRAMRGQMWSPGRPSTARREDRVRFWEAVARGVSSEDAAGVAGVSQAVGSRWFRQAGGMPPICLAPVSGRYLCFVEREEIAIAHAQGRRGAGDRATAGSFAVDDLEGAAPQRFDSQLRSAVSSDDPRSGTRSGVRAARRSPSSPATTRCAPTCRTVSPGRSPDPTASWWRDPMCASPVAAMGAVLIGVGRSPGVPSRSRTGCGSISPMMSRCESLMRPSTRRSTSRDGAHSSESS